MAKTRPRKLQKSRNKNVPLFPAAGKKRITVEISNLQNRLPIDVPELKIIIYKILRQERVVAAELSFVFVCDRRMRMLNRKYLGHDYATDVLAFDLGPRAKDRGPRRQLAGEIIISADTVRRQAKEFGQPPIQELILYICHGVLHLLGYDDHSPVDSKKMRAAEARLLLSLNK